MRTDEYGARWAGRYDALYAERDDVVAVVAFVDLFAPERSVLELGVGTGRIALPLAAAGYRVHGLDASPDMLAVLKGKPGSDSIAVTEGDMADFALDERFGVVTCLYSSLLLLADQGAQRRCLAAAARHLVPGGVLILETLVVDPDRWNGGFSVTSDRWGDTVVSVNVGRIDRAAQVIETVRVDVEDDHPTVLRNRLRYVWPAELDALAELAGLRLVHRTGDFAGRPFGPAAGNAVSVYRADSDPQPDGVGSPLLPPPA